ncbi:VOC family protein [Halogeometricum luteum]|uniref:VOC family protein n=1 Tax=Halogeometricum luteum TaxID=2950537 RepID=A0ABU2G1T8_9EURY|nr:VOC family protein [Halogeometricum sp. S3BR5-2]MDS0294734.1 VOC family protein [Halogeometricum sp. S3BR5-2]
MLTIDHVAFAGLDLDDLRAVAETVGLPTTYGGPHGTGTTHMAVVGLPDGSYLELVAPTEGTDPADAGFWPAHLAADAGPAGWCLDASDAAKSAKSAIDRGVRVDGPHEASRTRPDGTRVEWDMCFEGPDGDERLPFVVADRTPRSYRTTPDPDLRDSPLLGTAAVVLAVEDADASVDLLARRHRLPTPVDADGPFDRLRVCPGAPVALAEAGTDGALRERIETVGEGPCAYLLGVDDFEAARERFSLGDPFAFGQTRRRAAWFDHERFAGRLGVVERSD